MKKLLHSFISVNSSLSLNDKRFEVGIWLFFLLFHQPIEDDHGLLFILQCGT